MRSPEFPPGLYDLLKTPALRQRLQTAGLMDRAVWADLDPAELPNRLAKHLAREFAALLAEIFDDVKEDQWRSALEAKFSSSSAQDELLLEIFPEAAEVLHRITPRIPDIAPVRPDTPLAVSALFTGSSRSPALRTQLQKELASADRADWLVSFIKYAGVVPLLDNLRRFTQTPAPDGGPRLRIATTSYMGATDIKAIEELLKLPNTEIRVSYDTKRTRLHAKAYLFHRDTGFGSAYIGSANVSKAALDEGLEWTAKISQHETEHLWRHASVMFESHWEDVAEFSPCKQADLPTLRQALAKEQKPQPASESFSFFDLRPYEYQKAILEDIANEREAGKNKHLVIAATGTGKTMIAAFDYKRFAEQKGLPRLLFIAHREEILKQARSAFRQVIRDGSFGELVKGGAELTQHDHLFCTVQSWNSRKFVQFPSDYFDYVILDEAHHASADSYQAIISHIKPQVLLGLTATPERSNGADIRNDFGGAFTHEIRLPEAVERALLCPFHYFGIPDLDGLDFSSVAWSRGGYDLGQLAAKVEGNENRAKWVISQSEKFLTGLKQVRGLGFCVSVKHAEFMANFCTDNGIPSIALTAESPHELRMQAQRRLESREISFIFTVDLYNEGVDIPCVDTVIFLRPTESLTLFLQQLGRGLRLYDEKPHLTVLDFIAPQHRQFRFGKRFQALSSRPEIRIDRQIENDMPYLPAGCLLHLERQAKEHVLRNIRESLSNLRGGRLFEELRTLRNATSQKLRLEDILDFLHMDDPDELYSRGIPHLLLADAAGERPQDEPLQVFSDSLAKGFQRLNQMDDVHLLSDMQQLLSTGTTKNSSTPTLFNSLLWKTKRPDDGSLAAVQQFISSRPGLRHDLTELLDWLICHRTPLPAIHFSQTGPLTLHASYTREQSLLALGLGSFESPRSSWEGVLHVPESKVDVFFADINKSEADFSPTTMYEDYAITDKLFHWQSQSGTSVDSPTGRRYLEHQAQGYTPLLFIRERKKSPNGLTSPYFFAGPLRYQRHTGSKPISITWEMEYPLPSRILSWARRVS